LLAEIQRRPSRVVDATSWGYLARTSGDISEVRRGEIPPHFSFGPLKLTS